MEYQESCALIAQRATAFLIINHISKVKRKNMCRTELEVRYHPILSSLVPGKCFEASTTHFLYSCRARNDLNINKEQRFWCTVVNSLKKIPKITERDIKLWSASSSRVSDRVQLMACVPCVPVMWNDGCQMKPGPANAQRWARG